MVLDYSKWDNIDVSDDSDVEPNTLSQKSQAKPLHKVAKGSDFTNIPNRDRGTQGSRDTGIGNGHQQPTPSTAQASTSARQGNSEKQAVLPGLDLRALQSECETNEYLLKRLESLLQALKKYPDNTANAGDIFFKVATGGAEDRKFKPASTTEDNRLQQSEQFKKYSFLIIDLCEAIESGNHESIKKGQCATLATYMNALKQEITTIKKHPKELQAKYGGMDKKTSVKALEKYMGNSPDPSDPFKASQKPTHTSAYVPINRTAIQSEAYKPELYQDMGLLRLEQQQAAALQKLAHSPEIAALKLELKINEFLVSSLEFLLGRFKEHQNSEQDPHHLFFETIMEYSPALADRPVEGTEDEQSQLKELSERYVSLMDNVGGTVEEEFMKTLYPDVYACYIRATTTHVKKAKKLQDELQNKLLILESVGVNVRGHDVEDSSSQSLSPGSDSKPAKQHSGAPSNTTDVETSAGTQSQSQGLSRPERMAKAFAQIEYGDYRELYKFILYSPDFLDSEESVKYLQREANASQQMGADVYGRRCLHHWYLLKLCRDIGANLFFSRMINQPSEASKWFQDEVDKLYEEIKERWPAPDAPTFPSSGSG